MTSTTTNTQRDPHDRGVNRLVIRRALKRWTLEGSVATVQITLTSGVFQTAFAIYIGCNDFVIGLMAAIPALAGLLQLFSSAFADRIGGRKQIVCWASLVSRFLWIPMLLIPFVLRDQKLWVPTFLVLTGAASVLANIAAPLWMAWMSDLVPADHRGRYFGIRNMYAGFTGMTVSIAGGYFLDATTKHKHLSEPIALGILFAVGTVFAVFSFLLANSSPDVELRKSTGTFGSERRTVVSTLQYYMRPFSDRNYSRVMLFYAGIIVAQSVAGQYFVVNQLKYLHLTYTAFQLLNAVAGLSSLMIMPLWGYLIDKYGNKPILIISCFLVLIPPFLWLFASPDSIPGLWMMSKSHHLLISYSKLDILLLNTIAGMGWAGVGSTQFNLTIGAAPSDDRPVYVGAINALTGICGGIAPLMGGLLLTAMHGVHFSNHGLIRNGYHVLFIISGVLRGLSMLVLKDIKEPGSNSASFVLTQLKGSKPLASISNIRALTRPGSADKRQRAAENLAKLKNPVAVEELLGSLDDVSLLVREKAALALGEIGDSRAVTVLMQKLSDPSSGISSEAAIALGKIGDKSAFAALSAAAQLGPPQRQVAAVNALGMMRDVRVPGVLKSLINSADISVRTQAVRALAECEDAQCESVFIDRIAKEDDPAVVSILGEGLGRFGSSSAIPILMRTIYGSESVTVKRTLFNAIGSLAGGRDAFYPMLALDSYARDETVSKVLMAVQRKFRRSAISGSVSNERASIRSKQALRAYVASDWPNMIVRLCQVAEFIKPLRTQEIQAELAPFMVLNLACSAEFLESADADLALLCVFCVSVIIEQSRTIEPTGFN